MPNHRAHPPAVAIAVVAVVIAGCDAGLAERGNVAARVNGQPVSMARLRSLEQWSGSHSTNVDREGLLRSLVDRELLAQRAAELHLDRRPDVRAALDEARGETLARAYVDSLLPAQPPEAPQVDAFYLDNPGLFRDRQRYHVVELAIEAPEPMYDAVRDKASRSASLTDVADWLRAGGIAYRAGGASKTSEALAPELLTALASMKEGQIAVVAAVGRLSVIQLLSREPAPLSLATARPLIAGMLRDRRRAETAAREARALRAGASIQTIAFASPEREYP